MFSTFLLALLLPFSLAQDIILKPLSGKTGSAAGFILLQGYDVKTSQYLDTVNSIAQVASTPLYIGIPECKNNICDPLNVNTYVSSIYRQMQEAGLSDDAPVILAGHSLGGASAQSWSSSAAALTTLPTLVAQILMGSYITRENRHHGSHDSRNFSYPIPTLTLAGELDGLTRITRIAEQFYVQQTFPGYPPQLVTQFPVIYLPGVSHLQFADNSSVPSRVAQLDLQPEASFAHAHEMIGNYSGAYIDFILNRADDQAENIISSAVLTSSKTFFTPIIEAQLLEGSYHYNEPCYCEPLVCERNATCNVGSLWTMKYSVPVMASFRESDQGYALTNLDSFHRVYTVMLEPPYVHEPHVFGNCTLDQPDMCEIRTETVTQNVYENATGMFMEDNSLAPNGAIEVRTKLLSRQNLQTRRGYPNTFFNETDDNNNCGQINQASIDYALGVVDKITLSRYQSVGVPLVIEQDFEVHKGPDWIWNLMNYTSVTRNGEPALAVGSISMKTPMDFPLKGAAGFHYCKVLSPAWVMDWIYIDSLRLRRSIA